VIFRLASLSCLPAHCTSITLPLVSASKSRCRCSISIAAIRDVESELAAMKAEHDPLASHIFLSRRHYRNVKDTKSGKRREMIARLSFNTACELGFRGSLDEWERLMGAVARR
jgi:hypothetical protein